MLPHSGRIITLRVRVPIGGIGLLNIGNQIIAQLLSEHIEGEAGKNFMWQELKGAHDFRIWYLGFYNFAQLAFD